MVLFQHYCEIDSVFVCECMWVNVCVCALLLDRWVYRHLHHSALPFYPLVQKKSAWNMTVSLTKPRVIFIHLSSSLWKDSELHFTDIKALFCSHNLSEMSSEHRMFRLFSSDKPWQKYLALSLTPNNSPHPSIKQPFEAPPIRRGNTFVQLSLSDILNRSSHFSVACVPANNESIWFQSMVFENKGEVTLKLFQ